MSNANSDAPKNTIDEASTESFPASDPPAWTVSPKSHPHPQTDPLTQKVALSWNRNTQDFLYETYNRDATVIFGGQETLVLSNPEAFYGDPRFANAEELLLASVSFCFMQTVLAIASKQHYVIRRYLDHAVAHLEKNAEGRFWIGTVELNPEIYVENQDLLSDEVKKLQTSAERHCFIANSLRSTIHIEMTAHRL